MEPGTGRKRPWEDDDTIELQVKRRGSTVAAPPASPFRPTSPLPHEAGHYSRGNRILDQRRLPPLYTWDRNASAESTTARSVPVSAPAQAPSLLDIPRPRSQSLSNVSQQAHWQEYEQHAGMRYPSSPRMSNRIERKRDSRGTLARIAAFLPYLVSRAEPITDRPVDYNRTRELNASSLSSGAEVQRLPLGAWPVSHATRASNCCSPHCQGRECLKTRDLMHKLAAEVTLLKHKVGVVTQTKHHSSGQVSCPSQ
jgi:hypothetical protein